MWCFHETLRRRKRFCPSKGLSRGVSSSCPSLAVPLKIRTRGQHLDPDGEKRSPGSRVPLQEELRSSSTLWPVGTWRSLWRNSVTAGAHGCVPCPWLSGGPLQRRRLNFLSLLTPLRSQALSFPGSLPACDQPGQTLSEQNSAKMPRKKRDHHPSKLTCAWWILITVFNRGPGAGFISWLHRGRGWSRLCDGLFIAV